MRKPVRFERWGRCEHCEALAKWPHAEWCPDHIGVMSEPTLIPVIEWGPRVNGVLSQTVLGYHLHGNWRTFLGNDKAKIQQMELVLAAKTGLPLYRYAGIAHQHVA